jgi:hypothetical protein
MGGQGASLGPPSRWHHQPVEDMTPCAFPPCARQGVETLRIVVSRTELILLACPSHADWLRGYAEEDAQVQFPTDPRGSAPGA